MLSSPFPVSPPPPLLPPDLVTQASVTGDVLPSPSSSWLLTRSLPCQDTPSQPQPHRGSQLRASSSHGPVAGVRVCIRAKEPVSWLVRYEPLIRSRRCRNQPGQTALGTTHIHWRVQGAPARSPGPHDTICHQVGYSGTNRSQPALSGAVLAPGDFFAQQ